ncbi:MAG TPA: cobalamin B12-binding domain-containing protein [Myxococcales bacterium]|jgi:hypothetical protein
MNGRAFGGAAQSGSRGRREGRAGRGRDRGDLGLRSIQASLEKAGHAVQVLDFGSAEGLGQVAEAIARSNPEACGLSMVFTTRAGEFIALASELRARGWRGHLTAGGRFASFHAEELLRDVPALDSILHGEGEEAVADLNQHAPIPTRGVHGPAHLERHEGLRPLGDQHLDLGARLGRTKQEIPASNGGPGVGEAGMARSANEARCLAAARTGSEDGRSRGAATKERRSDGG